MARGSENAAALPACAFIYNFQQPGADTFVSALSLFLFQIAEFPRQEIFEPHGIICYNIPNIKSENGWEIPAWSRVCAEAVSVGRTLMWERTDAPWLEKRSTR